MRRGLLAWSEDEVPRAVLEGRVERCRRAMEDAGLDCLLIYTNFPRPAAVSYLTHFVPYWSQGVLLVSRDRPPVLIASLSKRVGEWIASTAHLEGVVSTPDPGRAAGEMIADSHPGIERVGVVELPALPGGIARALTAALPGVTLVDASGLFAVARQPADATEIALSERAAVIAATALREATTKPHASAAPMISVIERTARLMEAEEILIRVAPDLAAGSRLVRIEDDTPLAARYAVQASVAYKGHWVRLGRSLARGGDAPAGWRETERRLDEAMAALVAGAPADRVLGDFAAWSVEGCTGTRPLSVLAANDGPADDDTVRAGCVRVLNLRHETGDGPWLASLPLLIGATPGEAARPLTAF